MRRLARQILPRRLRRPALVSLTFDDGTADHLSAGRLLAEHGLAGTFFVNSSRVGTGIGTLAWEGVAELARAGHEIGGHTADHVDLSSLTEAEAWAQVAEDRRVLLERGYAATSFAYPYGSVDTAARDVVSAAGYSSARRAWGLAAAGDSMRPATEPIPPADPYAIRTVPSLETGTTVDDLQRLVSRAEATGGWLPLVFHGLVGEGRYHIDEAVFSEFVGWLAGRSHVRVSTFAEVVERR